MLLTDSTKSWQPDIFTISTMLPIIYNSYNPVYDTYVLFYEGWNFNSGNYLFTTDTK